MSFEQGLALMPLWVQIWAQILSLIAIGAPIVMIFSKRMRLDGVLALAATIGMVVFFLWLYPQVGFTRILGLPHILFWTPLVIYLFNRVRKVDTHWIFSAACWLLILTLTTSLAFDYMDLARWLLGERGLMVTP